MVTEPDQPAVAWRILLAGVALLMILLALVIQATQATAIPPLIIAVVLLVVGLVLLILRPKIGAITVGVVSVLMVVGNLPFVLADIGHPESFWSFVPAALAVVGAVLGLAGLVAVLRHVGSGPASVVGVVGVTAAVAVLAVGAVSSGGQEDDVKQEGDIGMFAQDIEFKPDDLQAPAGELGVFIGNDDLVRHTFTIDELDVDEELPSKAFVRFTFEAEPGTYEFYCDVPGHEDMTGTLVVS